MPGTFTLVMQCALSHCNVMHAIKQKARHGYACVNVVLKGLDIINPTFHAAPIAKVWDKMIFIPCSQSVKNNPGSLAAEFTLPTQMLQVSRLVGYKYQSCHYSEETMYLLSARAHSISHSWSLFRVFTIPTSSLLTCTA
eukprot:scaffold287143_cov23-Tisochrysis_lutea.AAC.1